MQDSNQRRSAFFPPGFDNRAFDAHEPSHVRRHESQLINRFESDVFVLSLAYADLK